MKKPPRGGEKEVKGMDRLTYVPKSELGPIAREVLDFLRPKELPIWQIKEILAEASRLADWEILK